VLLHGGDDVLAVHERQAGGLARQVRAERADDGVRSDHRPLDG
jgi:hypothetical protein